MRLEVASGCGPEVGQVCVRSAHGRERRTRRSYRVPVSRTVDHLRLPSLLMDIQTLTPTRRLGIAIAAAVLVLMGVLALSGPALAATDDTGSTVTLAAEERERIPIAPTQRDQFGLLLYGFMALGVLAGGATLRRQLKGDRPQTDGEFRWR
jgi:hypothetical protein